jgi:hypothetical protein
MNVNLADTLVYADIRQLHQLAVTYQLECNRNSKHELIQSLHNRLTSPGFFVRLHDELSWEEKRFLLPIVYERKKEYSREALLSRARKAYIEKLEGKGHEQLVDKAVDNGWLFCLQSRYGTMYAMPDDLRHRWREIFVKEVHFSAYGNYTKPDFYRDDTYVLAYDVQQFLQYVQTNRVPLSKEGVMYRKEQQRVMERVAVQEALIDGKEWRFGYGRRFRDYPDRLALLYDFVYHQQWIKEQEEVVLTEAGMRQVMHMQQERTELAERLVSFWLLSYKKAIPAIESLWMLIGNVCETEWLAEEKLVDALKNWVRPFYYDSQEEVVRRRLLLMMVHLGLLRRGMLNGNLPGYTLTSWGKSVVNKMAQNCK